MMIPAATTLGPHLKRRGLTVRGLARRCCDPRHFQNAYYGRGTLRPDELVVITAALDAPVTEILDEATITRVFA